MDPGLTNDIVSFVCDEQLTDVEILRKAIRCQSRRAQLRLSGYRTLLRMLHVNPPLSSTSQVALFTGYLGCLAPLQPEPACLADVDLIPVQERESLLAVRKLLLRWCSSQLQQTIWDCDSHGTEVELHPKSRISVFLLSLLCGAASAEDAKALVSFGWPASALALRKLINLTLTEALPQLQEVQVILDEGSGRRRNTAATAGSADTSGATATANLLTGPEAAALMKIGVRVVRGPDWKWSDQVRRLTRSFNFVKS